MTKFILWVIYIIIVIFLPFGTSCILLGFPEINVPLDFIKIWGFGFAVDVLFAFGLVIFYALGKGAVDDMIDRRD